MANGLLQHMLKGYLAASIMLSAGFMNASILPEGPKGFYAKICGSGQFLFIPLEGGEDPEPTQPHMTACHAICANEELESEEDT